MDRPIWKGYISFGLVAIPIILFSAEKKSDIHLRLVDDRNKSRVRYLRVNEQTGEEVPWEHVAKGYEYEEGNYILLDEKDLKNISGEMSKTIEIESFIDARQLSYMDFDKPYYLVPDKKGDKGYVILRECLKSTKKAGITRVVIHTRQYLAALLPYKNALVLNLLHYHQEIKRPNEFQLPSSDLKSYKVTTKELTIAKQLVDSMTTDWHPEAYQDEFKVSLEHWIEQKLQHKRLKTTKRTPHKVVGNVINFADLLQKSLAAKKKHVPAKQSSLKRKKK